MVLKIKVILLLLESFFEHDHCFSKLLRLLKNHRFQDDCTPDETVSIILSGRTKVDFFHMLDDFRYLFNLGAIVQQELNFN